MPNGRLMLNGRLTMLIMTYQKYIEKDLMTVIFIQNNNKPFNHFDILNF